MTLPKRLEALVVDARFAFRYFARHKATVAIIVAVLSLGVGANTMIFTMFRGEFLRPAAGVPDDPSHARRNLPRNFCPGLGSHKIFRSFAHPSTETSLRSRSAPSRTSGKF